MAATWLPTATRWHRQRRFGAQALGPGLYSLMVDYAPGIHIGQGLACQAAAFFFLVDPGRKRLFNDPVLGALQALSDLVDTHGEIHRDVSCDGSGFG